MVDISSVRIDGAAMQDAGRMMTERSRTSGDESGGGSNSAAPSGYSDIDPMEVARAGEAAQAIHAYYAGLIAALYADRSLTPEQRRAAIAELRKKAKADALDASQHIMRLAKSAAKLRRETMRRGRRTEISRMRV